MRPTYIALTVSLLILASCNSGNIANTGAATDSAKNQTTTPREAVKSKLSDSGTSMLMDVVTKYYALKNALVATKAAQADSAANGLATAADNMQAFLKTDTTAPTTLKPFIDTIISQSKIVSAQNDETCERQRLAFGTLSSAMYGLLKTAGLKNAHVYQDYCPMAFNEKGAFWLSDDSEIKNPYFGKKMIECGEITDSL